MIFKRCLSDILEYICASIHINIAIKVIMIISKCCHSNLHTLVVICVR